MSKVITITNQKGGTGKTTTTLFLAYGLADRGKHVLVIDLDQQADTTFSLTHGREYDDSDRTSYEAITQQRDIRECIMPLNLLMDLIPANSKLATLDIALMQNNMYRADLLKEVLDPIKNNFDFILIDTPPALSEVVTNALVASDYVLIPTQADLYSLKGLADLAKTLRKVPNPDLDVLGILITRFNPRTVYSRAIEGELMKAAQALDTRVFTSEIREAVAVKESMHQFKSLFDYAKRAAVTKDVNNFIDEVLRYTDND